MEWKNMKPTSTVSETSVRLRGKRIVGAEDRQGKIPGFDQRAYSRSRVVGIGAGGLMSFIAPTLARKGIGALALLDADTVEPSNLNRQRFYEADLYHNKAIALATHLQPECIFSSDIKGYALRLEQAIARQFDLGCEVAVCGVDNNPARALASRYFRQRGIPVIFTAVSAEGDHGYVFVQERTGPCLACLLPDVVGDDTFPCPGTPAIADILQAVGALAVYAVDTLLMARPRSWNYRSVHLADGRLDAASKIPVREGCRFLPLH